MSGDGELVEALVREEHLQAAPGSKELTRQFRVLDKQVRLSVRPVVQRRALSSMWPTADRSSSRQWAGAT